MQISEDNMKLVCDFFNPEITSKADQYKIMYHTFSRIELEEEDLNERSYQTGFSEAEIMISIIYDLADTNSVIKAELTYLMSLRPSSNHFKRSLERSKNKHDNPKLQFPNKLH
jgi:hypothetical protein